MKKLVSGCFSLMLLVLTLLVVTPVGAIAQQPSGANPAGPDAAPQQGEVQQTPGQQTPETAHRPVAEAPAIGFSAPNEGGMRLNVVVTDKSGNPVPGLSQQEFTVLDNGQPRPIVSFHAYPGAGRTAGPPVETVLLLDTLNMSALEVAQSKIALDRYLRMNGGHLPGPTSVFVFAQDGLQGQSSPSTDGNALANSMIQLTTHLRIGNQGTGSALDAFNISLKALGVLMESESRRPGRKLLIWVGPGWPLGEGGGHLLFAKTRQNDFMVITNLSRMAREDQITVYDVSLGAQSGFAHEYESFVKGAKSANDANPSYLNTKVIAVQSGGLVLGPDNDLARQIQECAQDATAYYTITIDPARGGKRDEYHTIQVQTDKPYLKARTTTLYYAEP